MTTRNADIGCLTEKVVSCSPASRFHDTFTYVDISSVDAAEKAITATREISVREAPSRARQVIRGGDVLVSTVRPNLNAVALVPASLDGSIASTGFCVLRPDTKKLWGSYLYFWVRTPMFVDEMTRLATGAGYPAVSDKIVKRSQVPLPPLDIQKKIATVLEKADRLRRLRKQANQKLDQLLQAVFLDMFGDPVRNAKGWGIVDFGEAGELERGVSKHRPRNAPELLYGPHPLVQTGEVASCRLRIRTYTHTYSETGLKQSKMWPCGTLCITIAANIAKTGVLEFDACFPDSVVGFTPSKKCTTEYVQVLLSFLQRILEDNAPESAQKNINLAILRELSIPLPPIALQSQFSRIYRRITDVFDQMDQWDVQADEVFNCLLQRAFKGELTFNDAAFAKAESELEEAATRV